MRVLTVTYNENADSTNVKFSDELQERDWLVKADILKDIICELEAEYEMLLTIDELSFRNEWILGTTKEFYREYKDSVNKNASNFLIKSLTGEIDDQQVD